MHDMIRQRTIELYRPALDALDDHVRQSFLGDNVAECFARTENPLS